MPDQIRVQTTSLRGEPGEEWIIRKAKERETVEAVVRMGEESLSPCAFAGLMASLGELCRNRYIDVDLSDGRHGS